MKMDTWNKRVRVNGKRVKKKAVRDYYKKLWNKDKGFRDNLRKRQLFIRADYDGKQTIVRNGVKIREWNDLETLIKNHSVEFHLPVSQYNYNSYVDIDMPPRYVPRKRAITKSLMGRLKRKGVNIALVVDSPSGAHIFSNTKRQKVKEVLKEIAAEDARFAVKKTSKTKIVLDPAEPNAAVPGSLSCRGRPYRKWRK
jgi:hypothetical protein